MNRKLLLPIIALVVLMLKQFAGVEFDSQQIDVLVEGFLAISILTGFAMNPKKKK